MIDRLLVPMYMDALVLSKDGMEGTDVNPKWEYYDQSVLGEEIRATRDSISLGRGIHLHWTLPKALKHSFLEGTGHEMEFPLIPNRWMVVRLQTSQGLKAIPSKQWIIESDSAGDEADSGAHWATVGGDGDVLSLEIKSVGKATEYIPAWTGTGAKPFLTAVGAANPQFASFYPGCVNVLGFHDDLADIDAECSLTYVVTGWYSTPEADPLFPPSKRTCKATTAEEIALEKKGLKKKYNWIREQWKVEGESVPEQSLFHASLHTILWQPYENNRLAIPTATVQVAFGSTSAEALSAKIANAGSASKTRLDTEALVNALQYSLLEDDFNPPTINKIQEEVHRRGFNAKNGGSIWEIKRTETDDAGLQQEKSARKQFPDVPELARYFTALNAKQIELNQLQRNKLSLQQEYYFLWYKKVLKIRGLSKVPFQYQQARDTVSGRINAIDVQADVLSKGVGGINELITIIRSFKEFQANQPQPGDKAQFALLQREEERFWEPANPVLLMSAAGLGGVDNAEKYQSGPISCRVISQVNLELMVDVANISKKTIDFTKENKDARVSVPGADGLVSPQSPGAEAVPVTEIQALCYETLLFDQALTADIALLRYQLLGFGGQWNKTQPEVMALAAELLKLQTSLWANGATTSPLLNGRLPEPFAMAKWKQPWAPLFMDWKVQYHPSFTEVAGVDLRSNSSWALADNLFEFKGQTSSAANSPLPPFDDIVPYATSLASSIQLLLPLLHADVANPTADIISQAVSGFNEMLLMRKPGLQFPPLEYSGDENGINSEFKVDHDELNHIGPNGYRLGSNPGDFDDKGSSTGLFHPLRAGYFEIKHLSVIDSFGQKLDVVVPGQDHAAGVLYPKVYKPLIPETTPSRLIPLPPRIIQPTRLQFHWLSADNERILQDCGPALSPVFGWLVPNLLDNSLMVYDSLGHEVCIMQLVSDADKSGGVDVQIRPFPGASSLPDGDMSSNKLLKKWLYSIKPDPDAADNSGIVLEALIDLAAKVNLEALGVAALQNNGASLVAGQPIALARVSILLETYGLPATDQRFEQSGLNDSGGIEKVVFPAYIGDFSRGKDGLIGYMIEDEAVPGIILTVNAPEFKNQDLVQSFLKPSIPLPLSLNQAPVNLTLLLDPSAGVHISTGVLPTKYVALPPHSIGEVLADLNISFMVAPFLSDKPAAGIPLPKAISADWSWVQKSGVQTWEPEEVVQQNSSAKEPTFAQQQAYEGWLKLSHVRKNKTS